MVASSKERVNVRSATVRFAGDSGDGMQLAGMRFTDTSAMVGNDIATLPDFPAEIRAPAGTVAGVSGFQVNFSSADIHTPGDKVDALIAMNPAAFKANIADVRAGGAVIVNESEFNKVNLRKAGYAEDGNPLDDEDLSARYKIYKIPLTRLTREELADSGLGAKDALRCKNMYALGLIYYLYDRPLDGTIRFIEDTFIKRKNMPEVAAANVRALRAGFDFGDTAEIFPVQYQVDKAPIEEGTYRRITGNEATAMGFVAASKLSGKQLVYNSYPITPASDVLHYMAAMRHFGVKTFQAEDEIAAVCSAIGVAYTGQLGICGTSGPGIALKSEAIGLAVMTELPLVVIGVQRGGPSTGLPTKVEQADLLQAMYGRNGEAPVIVMAPRSPSDCFETAMEAARLAFQTMSPVIYLSDGYIANGAEPWRIPDPEQFAPIRVEHPTAPDTPGEKNGDGDGDGKFLPYQRDENLVRPWAVPGTPGLQHRVGGLEKEHLTGNVCYDGENHQLMIDMRREKIDRLARRIPPLEADGPESGDLLLLGWGGTYGALTTAATRLREQGHSVAHAHLRHLNPMPANTGDLLRRYKRVLIPELNMGQLRMLIRGRYLIDARGLNKVQCGPFLIEEVEDAARLMLGGEWGDREFLTPHHHHTTTRGQSVHDRLRAIEQGRHVRATA